MVAYEVGEWSELFVAVAGATAALAGLVFVAVSINIERILSFQGLPERGLETMLLLVAPLIISIAALVPGLSTEASAIELLAVTLFFAAVIFRLPTASSDPAGPARGWTLTRWSVRLVAIVPLLIGGVTLWLESGGGLYWVAAGIVFAIVGAVANAWVLLVEILR